MAILTKKSPYTQQQQQQQIHFPTFPGTLKKLGLGVQKKTPSNSWLLSIIGIFSVFIFYAIIRRKLCTYLQK